VESSSPRTVAPASHRRSSPYRGADGRWYVAIDDPGARGRRYLSARSRRGLAVRIDEWQRTGRLPAYVAPSVGGGRNRAATTIRVGSVVLCAAALLGAGRVVDHSITPPRTSHRRIQRGTGAPGPVADPNPLALTAITSYLTTRTSNVTMALYDADNGRTYTYRPQLSEQTGSIIKLSILATLLHQHQQGNTPLDPLSVELLTSMIEHSSDAAASELWAQLGPPAVAAYDRSAGLTDTKLGALGLWGESTTTAADQVQIVRSLVYPNSVLDPASQAAAQNLMENLETDQRWGVSAGVPTGVTVALKDGWVPLTSYYDWQVNSVGWVDGDGCNYVLAILTDDNDSEQYGIDTIQQIAPLVWDELAPRADASA
jgi:beta-lactamase class A